MSSNDEFVSIVDNLDIKIVRFVAQDVYLFDNSTIHYSPKPALHYKGNNKITELYTV